jgi:hypothetical protein
LLEFDRDVLVLVPVVGVIMSVAGLVTAAAALGRFMPLVWLVSAEE